MLWPPGFKANILTLISSNSDDDSNSDGKDGSSDDDITALEFSSRTHISTPWNPKVACNTIWNTPPHFSSLPYTVQQILTYLLLRRWNVFPIVYFGTLNMKKVTKSLDRLQFPRKVNKLMLHKPRNNSRNNPAIVHHHWWNAFALPFSTAEIS
jgi:hypothetical protein